MDSGQRAKPSPSAMEGSGPGNNPAAKGSSSLKPSSLNAPSLPDLPGASARGKLAIAACALMWSSGGLLIKLVPADPVLIASGRGLVALLTMAVLLRGQGLGWPWQPSAWDQRQFWAGVCYALTMLLFVAANKLTSSANAILLQYAAPVYVAVLAALFLKERLRLKEIVALAVVAGGILLFFGEELEPGGLIGNILALVSGVFFAVSLVLMRAQKHGNPAHSFALANLLLILVGLPFWVAQITALASGQAAPAWSSPLGEDFVPGFSALGGIFALGIFQIGIPSLLFSWGVKHVAALPAALLLTLEPVLNPVWVLLATGEVPSPVSVAGGLVILAAVLYLQLSDILGKKAALAGADGGSRSR